MHEVVARVLEQERDFARTLDAAPRGFVEALGQGEEVGEVVEVLGEAKLPPLRATPEEIPLDVVYEDDSLAVVNKPAGMMVHAGSGATATVAIDTLNPTAAVTLAAAPLADTYPPTRRSSDLSEPVIGFGAADLTAVGGTLANFMAAKMPAFPQLAPVGRYFSYNNTGPVVAARILEVVTGTPYR